ncbi:MAG: hypothetical protein Q9185_004898 [Variospora sp. 1 TL-2023]
MSLDLLEAFGNTTCEEPANPWATSSVGTAKDHQTIEEDDFGEFEQAALTEGPECPIVHAEPRATPALPADVQRNGTLVDTTIVCPPPPPSPSFQKANASLKLAIPPEPEQKAPADTKPAESTPVTAWPSSGRNRAKSSANTLVLSPYADDDWGDFEEEPRVGSISIESAERRASATQDMLRKPTAQTASLIDLDGVPERLKNFGAQGQETTVAPLEPAAPSNMPPPSVLLSVIASNFQTLSARIRDIISLTSTLLVESNHSNNERVLEDLTKEMATIRVSTRILAGRRLRWKRDTHLAQSMRIGPANAGRPGGMKLTGVDRAENRREDQEAAEIVRLWKQQVGGLKSHFARINAQQSEIEYVLPDISENMPIRTAKVGEGALTAPRCCFLCGLKRDERVARLDTTVEDSFAEWWVDHWGHVDCIRFWAQHKGSLRQRS